MRIGIISDTHDNIWKLKEAIPYLRSADIVLHCGDLISPFIIVILGEGLPGIPIHVVWGNNDGDQRLLLTKALAAGNITVHGQFAVLDLEGFKIAINHYPEIAAGLAASGKYDLVCYGHDHTAHFEIIGETSLLNPGEIMGLNGPRTLAFFDTETREVEWVNV